MELLRSRRTRGHFEELHADDRVCRVSGWMLNPSTPVDVFEVLADGKLLTTAAPDTRPDVKRLYAWIPHASRSGFQFALPVVDADLLVVRGKTGGEVSTELRAWRLVRRVTGQDRVQMFRAEAQHWCAEFSDLVGRHMAYLPVGRMLDWGCGCGRLTTPLLQHHTAIEVHGCDIDEEAIVWCRKHLPGAHFQVIAPHPPTSYPTGWFDVVIASSVFTHLSQSMQAEWLLELKRIVRPGGIVVASVHGRFASSFAFRSLDFCLEGRAWHYLLALRMTATGFVDLVDRSFDGLAPGDYYRQSFQTPRFTMRAWSKHFEILEYVEGALAYQDVVVMRQEGPT